MAPSENKFDTPAIGIAMLKKNSSGLCFKVKCIVHI